MWKWTGTQFEGVSAEEAYRFETATDRPPSPEFSDYQGWSGRILTVRPTNPFPVTLTGRTITISKRESEDTRRIEIDRRNGSAPETIWSLDTGIQRVDRATSRQNPWSAVVVNTRPVRASIARTDSLTKTE
jgi:hypothetical protein